MSTYESMRVERTGPLGHVAEVCLVGPGNGNAMGYPFFRELPEVFTSLDRDEGVRAVILRGMGGVFSYGLDLKSVDLSPHFQPNNLAKERTKLLDLLGEWQRGFDLVERCRKPVIAAVAGPCIGGGVDLATAADIRLASKDARFSVREVKVAIVADMGSLQRLPRIVGQSHARELAFTGKDISGERALRMGLVSEVYDDEATLLEAARTLAREIADNPPLVVQGIKQVMSFSEGRSVEEGERFTAVWNAAFLASEDVAEAMQAFAARRAPTFRGR